MKKKKLIKNYFHREFTVISFLMFIKYYKERFKFFLLKFIDVSVNIFFIIEFNYFIKRVKMYYKVQTYCSYWRYTYLYLFTLFILFTYLYLFFVFVKNYKYIIICKCKNRYYLTNYLSIDTDIRQLK